MRKQRFHPAQIVTAALAAGFLVWFCLPGFFNAGTFLGVLLSLLIAAAALLFPHIARGVKWLWKRIPGRAALCALCAAAAVFAGYLGFCGVQMARYSSRPLEQVNAVMAFSLQSGEPVLMGKIPSLTPEYAMPSHQGSLCMDKSGAHLYVSNRGANTVTVFRTGADSPPGWSGWPKRRSAAIIPARRC